MNQRESKSINLVGILKNTGPGFIDGQKLLLAKPFRRYNYYSWIDSFKNTPYSHIGRPLARAGFFCNDKGEIKCHYCQEDFPEALQFIHIGDDVLEILNNIHSCEYVIFMKNSRPKHFFGYDSLRYESERLETFIDWQCRDVSPFDLAKAGFFYMRWHDYCACIYCGGIIGNFKDFSDPAEEHAKHFPNCPFILGNEPVGNVPMEHCIELYRLTEERSYYASPPPRLEPDIIFKNECFPRPSRPTKSSRAISNLGKRLSIAMTQSIFIQVDQERNKSIYTMRGRISTFKNFWCHKLESYKTINSTSLAKAGFYYTGVGDHVACFACNVNIRNLESCDNIWKEHFFASPTCKYVQQYASISKKLSWIASQNFRRRASYLGYKHGIEHYKVRAILPKLMESDVIRAALTEGQDYNIVLITLFFRICRMGVPFFNLNSLKEELKYHTEIEVPGLSKNPLDVRDLPPPIYHKEKCSSCPYCIFMAYLSFKDDEDIIMREINDTKKEDIINNDTKNEDCKVCYQVPSNAIFLPCKHMVCCSSCATKVRKGFKICPICRTEIKRVSEPGYRKLNYRGDLIMNLPCNHLVNENEVNLNNFDNCCPTCNTVIQTKKRIVQCQDTSLCVQCKQSEAEVIHNPCMHMLSCQKCAETNKQCPKCHVETTSVILPFKC